MPNPILCKIRKPFSQSSFSVSAGDISFSIASDFLFCSRQRRQTTAGCRNECELPWTFTTSRPAGPITPRSRCKIRPRISGSRFQEQTEAGDDIVIFLQQFGVGQDVTDLQPGAAAFLCAPRRPCFQEISIPSTVSAKGSRDTGKHPSRSAGKIQQADRARPRLAEI